MPLKNSANWKYLLLQLKHVFCFELISCSSTRHLYPFEAKRFTPSLFQRKYRLEKIVACLLHSGKPLNLTKQFRTIYSNKSRITVDAVISGQSRDAIAIALNADHELCSSILFRSICLMDLHRVGAIRFFFANVELFLTFSLP